MRFSHSTYAALALAQPLSATTSPPATTTLLSATTATCSAIPDALKTFEDLVAKQRTTNGVCDTSEAPSTIFRRDDDFSCSESEPCSNEACCSKDSGYCGYGPDYCGTTGESPNDICWSNCDAHAECGRFAETPGQTCPLNVCCSQFGFCGTTALFCEETNDKNATCQSNCAQPSSGSSDSDVQKRIVGYYEAFKYNQDCVAMKPRNLPVGSLTHLNVAFGYIEPDSFAVLPMKDFPSDVFTKVTAMKSQNPDLKVLVSLGGWTFNDNDTATQAVFGDISRSSANRKKFVDNLLDFMQQYGFDGADFDWEYPGAPDRGGQDDDGENYTKLLQELRLASDEQDRNIIISFTAPTSYWYLRWFDLENMMDQVDFVNVMSYDLHGMWDGSNSIGKHVLAHTNLTEIKSALDLYWRNNVDPAKVNLGLGFYGRSFQLADPSCFTPGCLFKAGGTPGSCSDTSGVLTYQEITDVITQYDLTPYYDQDAQVKYVTWSDQWVSYDDKETFQAKVRFGNDTGLGGLLIWALDQDTKDLDALAGVIAPRGLGSYGSQAQAVDNWGDVPTHDCRVTQCGKTGCNVGEVEVTQQQCSGRAFSSEGLLSSLCCPISAAPDPHLCKWRGSGSRCNGRCHDGEVAMMSSRWGGPGDIDYCSLDGLRFYCCEVPDLPQCRWTDCGKPCDATKESTLTWRDGNCHHKKHYFCCDKDESWKNCAWHGKPGSCFDNHCDTGHQVALTTSWEGEGRDCGLLLSRQRSFCCDPGSGKSSFLPVPLDYLFENPPPAETAETDFKLEVDPTYGGSVNAPDTNDPDSSAFGFAIITAPEELHVTLDKRDGSHWDVFDCFDSVSQGEHVVRMACTDDGPDSNCHKIYLGHGVPGTILEMPSGCGSWNYAVAKSLSPSLNQTLPDHLARRGLGHGTTIYDLTFDYDWRRVPRDLGEPLFRVDYSNEAGYWDKVVDHAAKHKRKRDAGEHRSNHKRWLEESWREDKHLSGLTHQELAKRWFGQDVIDWLHGLINGVEVSSDVQKSNTYRDDFIVHLVKEQWGPCNIGGVDVQANLDVTAEAHVEVDTNYGLTIITTLAFPPDLSKSYLYFRNKGEVTSKFSIVARAQAHFSSGDVEFLAADKFGAAFTIPGILTIGPNFKLIGLVEGQAEVSATVEATVKLASWDVRQTFPDVNRDWDPATASKPDRSSAPVGVPQLDAEVRAEGFITAHLKPTFTFGIDFKPTFLDVPSCTVNLAADGYFTLHADASTNTNSFCYDGTAGADLIATVDAPEAFGWKLPQDTFQIAHVDPRTIIPRTCPAFTRDIRQVQGPGLLQNQTSALISGPSHPRQARDESPADTKHVRRGGVYGPPNALKLMQTGCPGEQDDDFYPCPRCLDGQACIYEDGRSDESSCPYNAPSVDVSARSSPGHDRYSFALGAGDHNNSSEFASDSLSKRDDKKCSYTLTIGGTESLSCGPYPSCGNAADSKASKWWGFGDDTNSKVNCAQKVRKFDKTQIDTGDFATDHVYEAQLVTGFLMFLKGSHSIALPRTYGAATDKWIAGTLIGLNKPGFRKPWTAWEGLTLFQHLTQCLGGKGNTGQLALLEQGINVAKGAWFHLYNPAVAAGPKGSTKFTVRETKRVQRNAAGTFQYMNEKTIKTILRQTSIDIEIVLEGFDEKYPWSTNPVADGEIVRPTRAPGQGVPGLRDLYCYYIDKVMEQIETNAKGWVTRARTELETNTDLKDSPEIKSWLNSAFGGSGLISTTKMQFDKPNPVWTTGVVVAASTYGMWEDEPAGPF